MPLGKAAFISGLASDLGTIFADVTGKSAATKANEIATAIGNRLDTYVKSGTVTTTIAAGAPGSGLQTSTAVGAPTGGPASPRSLIGTIS